MQQYQQLVDQKQLNLDPSEQNVTLGISSPSRNMNKENEITTEYLQNLPEKNRHKNRPQTSTMSRITVAQKVIQKQPNQPPNDKSRTSSKWHYKATSQNITKNMILNPLGKDDTPL